MDHQLDVIDRTVAKTYEWVHQVAERDDFDDLNRAYHVLRAVLHALRDRVEPNVAAHVAAQLPLLVRGDFLRRLGPGEDAHADVTHGVLVPGGEGGRPQRNERSRESCPGGHGRVPGRAG